MTQENKRRPGRPSKIVDGASWLEGLISDAPKAAADIISAAEERGISERSLTRIKGKLFRQLNVGEEGSPWRAFQRGNKWYWGLESMLPKRNTDGQILRGDGSAAIDTDSVAGVVSPELLRMNAKAKPLRVKPAPKLWDNREAWSAIPSMSKELLEQHMAEIQAQPNWFDNSDMVQLFTLLAAAAEKETS